MIKTYIIDGNNLMGKIPELFKLMKTDGNGSRVKLARMLDDYLRGKKQKISLHFDGFPAEGGVRASKCKIQYSENRTADDNIKDEISHAKNPKVLCVISSDFSVKQFAQKNACFVKTSEEFFAEMEAANRVNEETEKIKNIDNDEIKKLFGL